MQALFSRSWRLWYRFLRTDMSATFRLAYPIAIGQVGIVLLGITDTIMVGQLGKVPLAAAGFANTIFFIPTVVGIGIMSVLSPLVATAKTSQNEIETQDLFKSALLIALFTGILITIALCIAGYYIDFFGQPAEVNREAEEYIYIIAISAIPMLFYVAMRSYFDGLSFIKAGLYATYVALLLNVLLNWLLIYGHWGFPAWGLFGAGIATLIARVAMVVVMFYFVSFAPKIKHWIGNFKRPYNRSLTFKLLRLGIPAGLQYLFEMGAFSMAALMMGWLGTNTSAAHQIAINLAATTYLIAASVSSAGGIRVGNALGENDYSKIFRAGTTAFLINILFMFFACLVFVFGRDFLINLYIQDPTVHAIAAELLIIAAFFQLSDGIQVVGLGLTRGLEDVNVPTLITLISYWVVGIPLAYVLGFYWQLSGWGIWLALLIALTISATMLTMRFYMKLNAIWRKAIENKVAEKPTVEMPEKTKNWTEEVITTPS
ncbi:MAG: MATE family efflux transporter [Cytophagales bacterium]|nr:MAG: MATE family efflux transporter [Cytophagales bacterium]